MSWRQTLKNRLKARGVTLIELAELTNVTPPAVGHWLSGRREPPIPALKIMAEKAGMSLNELFGDSTTYLVVDKDEIRLVELARRVPRDQLPMLAKMIAALADQPQAPSEKDSKPSR